MAVSFWVDRDTGILHMVWTGEVTYGDVMQAISEIRAAFTEQHDVLVDVSGITGSSLEFKQVDEISGQPRHKRRIAIVAPSPAHFGMARMFEILSDVKDSPATIFVFKGREEALDWLGRRNSSAAGA